ncbi:membrane protein [Desulforamulus profundi]|uniref:Membrane protein n=1 Tax=Desulforamulus profundi TaxID=1383067 RepID=A0A2C6M8Y9_9FIRM|nr:phage holin family protein [Desulforamulus profundi]PHJ38757.1 membrane protein [Desulforamulus profundi]
MGWVLSLLLNSAALLAADYLIDSIQIDGFASALLAALVLGFVNTFIRPILVFLTFPMTVLTLGLFILVINAVTFGLVSWLVPGFHVYSFGGAFAGAIITGVTSWILNAIFSD